MINKIPNEQSKIFRVSYIGEFLGDFIHCFNLDLFKRGLSKVGTRVHPHTTGFNPPTDFCSAKLDSGTGGTGPTGFLNKVWTVSEDGIYGSYNKEAFQIGPTGAGNTPDSDILSVGDESGEEIETLVSISGSTIGTMIVNGTGATEMAGQSFKAGGPVEKITVNIAKVGTPVDDLKISIQGDDDGKPDGTPLISKTIVPADMSTSLTETEIEIADFTPSSLSLNTDTHWLVFERTGASSEVNYYIGSLILGGTTDPYERGEYKSFDGTNWNSYGEQDETDLEFPTANKSITGTTGWTDGDNAQSIINDNHYAYATPIGAAYSHAWHNFGFSLPTGPTEAIVSGVEVQTRMSTTRTGGIVEPIYLSLTKDANTKTGNTVWNAATNTVTTFTKGSSTDLWGTSLTASEVNNSNFGIIIDTPTPAPEQYSYRCMWIKVMVYYYIEGEGSFMDVKMAIASKFPASPERIYITTSDDVKFLNAEDGQWESLWQGILEKDPLNEDYPSILKNIGSGGTLLLANENKLHSMIATATSPAEAEENKLIFDSTHYINWLGITNSAVFIGLRHKESAYLPSQIVYYEPYSDRTRIFIIKEGETVGFIKDENCHIIDKKGQLRVFNGSGFQTYNYFPPYYRDEDMVKLPHRNGILSIGDIVKIAWEGQYPDPAGIWVYENDNLYHKHAVSYDNTKSFGSMEIDSLKAVYEKDDLYLGAGVENGSEAIIEGIYSDIDSSASRGHIKTSKMISPEIDNVWQDIVLKYRDGTFVAKQKVEADGLVEGSGATIFNGTWTTTTKFTCADAGFATAVSAGTIKVGDEIIVRKGAASGLLAHITDITGTTITIDSGLVSSGKFTFSVERWQR